MESAATSAKDEPQLRLAMNFSLGAGLLMLGIKGTAYALTGSTAILSDAAESIVHLAAVAFAVYSLHVSLKPADADHPYGHAKIAYFSAGFEGAMIALAALFIIYTAVGDWIRGPELQHLGIGTVLTVLAVLINGVLGWYLLRVGKKRNSLILTANGHHVLTDCWTSLGVIVGLVLALATGWNYWDPLLAILLALNILRSGFSLMRSSAGGLMDKTDLEMDARLRKLLDAETAQRGICYHQLRHRNLGNAWWVELHLLFPSETTVEEAHASATEIEDAVESAIPGQAFVTSHLEPVEGHDAVHRSSHFPHRG